MPNMPNSEVLLNKTNNLSNKNDINNKRKLYNNWMDNTRKEKIIKNRILCFNMLHNGKCPYLDNCKFAHMLDKQVIDKNKAEAINIINKDNIKDVDLMK